MAKRKPKYYVVWKGREPGIYTSWAECQAQVKGFPGAEFKSFPTREMAEAAWQSTYAEYKGKDVNGQQWLFAPNPPLLPSLCVDAACSGSPGPLEYQGVLLPEQQRVFHRGPYPDGTNNVGEFLALVHALAWLDAQGDAKMPVYTDSRVAWLWVRAGRCQTRLPQTSANAPLFALIARAERWLKAHPQAAERIHKWDTQAWGEIPADFNRK